MVPVSLLTFCFNALLFVIVGSSFVPVTDTCLVQNDYENQQPMEYVSSIKRQLPHPQVEGLQKAFREIHCLDFLLKQSSIGAPNTLSCDRTLTAV